MIDCRRHLKQVGTHRVLYVMAATAEYGPALRARIDPLICGVGPVESAIAMAAALMQLEMVQSLPQVIVSLGSAGSRTLHHAGVYQVASVAYRDIDASALGFERGTTPFADHPAIIAIQPRISGIPSASLSTGGAIISGSGYEAIGADMVDMETFALLRAAAYFGVSLIGLRGISDGQRGLERIEDWTEYLHVIDARLAVALEQFEAQLSDGTLRI